MMKRKTIEAVGKALGLRPETLQAADSFEKLHLGKQDLFSILTDLEDEFSIVLDYNKAASLRTIEDLQAYVCSKAV